MLAQADRAAEALADEVVEGGAAIVEVRVGNAFQVLRDQRGGGIHGLADIHRAYLFIVADDKQPVAEVPAQ